MATGIVTAMNAVSIDVEFAPPTRCKGCDGACLWYRVPARQTATFQAPLGVQVGSTVTVTLPERYLLLGTLLVYGVPLAALLAGAVLGMAALGSDLGATVGAAVRASPWRLFPPLPLEWAPPWAPSWAPQE